ncbi:MAG: zinc metallopeptidase [Coriobacteriia bacterium]|nr:zinc metallopeptidase [Coriobacteriia bacterium]
MFGMISPMYLLLIVASLVLGFGTQAYIKRQYKKYSQVPSLSGLTGAQAARRMLDANGLANVSVQMVGGELSDHFDPRSNVVSLSEGVYKGSSIASTAVACHECGHAVQHARAYAPARIRNTIVPVVNFASNIWMFALIIGVILGVIGFVWVAVIMYVAVLAFQLVTLPVELDASARALAYVKAGQGNMPSPETSGAKKVLTAAALTYVAAALISVLQLLWLLGMARR